MRSIRLVALAAVLGLSMTAGPAAAVIAGDLNAADDDTTVVQDSDSNLLLIGTNDSAPGPATFALLTGPSHGIAAVGQDSGLANYKPNAGYHGIDTFTYGIADGNGAADTATVTITVTPTGTPATDVTISTHVDDPEIPVGSQTFDSVVVDAPPAQPGGPVPPAPTGSVTFKLYGPGDEACTGQVYFTDTQQLTLTQAQSDPFTVTTAGAYSWRATYTGDSNYAAKTAPCNDVNEAVTVTSTSEPETNVVDVEAACSGEVTFTNLLSEEINVRYGPNDSLEGEFDLPADQSHTITTNARSLIYLAANKFRPASQETSRFRTAQTAPATVKTTL